MSISVIEILYEIYFETNIVILIEAVFMMSKIDRFQCANQQRCRSVKHALSILV